MLSRPLRDKVVTSSLHLLAVELVQEIFRYLHWPTDFYNLSLVSRTLNRLATRELYSILVIGYHRPHRISALLAHLEARPEVGSFVTTLVFDEDVKCIGPKALDLGGCPPRLHRRDLVDGWDPRCPDLLSLKSYPRNRLHEKISRQLDVVLRGLPNIRRVLVRNLHPLYRHTGLPKVKSGAVANGTLLPHGEPGSDSTVWGCLSRNSSFITELFVNGLTTHMPPKALISRLTTICISDIYYDMSNHALQACAWNVVLVDAVNLQTLCMIHVEYAHVILAGRSFPHLAALELYKVLLGGPHEGDTQALSQFLHRHSSTLRTLALSTHLWWAINNCSWLHDENILPNLQTLRLENIWALFGLVPDDDDRTLEMKVEKTGIIIDFINRRPTILDVGISVLATPQADIFAEYLARTRPMRNILIGNAVTQNLQHHISVVRRHSIALQDWQYIYEAWMFYELFGGLTLGRSGFRPRQPLPQTWKFWKKSFRSRN